MRFRKKPVVIQADQFWPKQKPWPVGVASFDLGDNGEEADLVTFRIETLEGWLNVSPGDWVITGVQGERYPCKPDIFEATYERVGEV